jgi:hypothetical protein
MATAPNVDSSAKNIKIETFLDPSIALSDSVRYNARISPMASVHKRQPITNISTSNLTILISSSQGNTVDPKIYVSTTVRHSLNSIAAGDLSVAPLPKGHQIVNVCNNWLANSTSNAAIRLNGEVHNTPASQIYEAMSRYVTLQNESDPDYALSLFPCMSYDRYLINVNTSCGGIQSVNGAVLPDIYPFDQLNPFKNLQDSSRNSCSRTQYITGVQYIAAGAAVARNAATTIYTQANLYSCVPSLLFDYYNQGILQPFLGFANMEISLTFNSNLSEGSSVLQFNRNLWTEAKASTSALTGVLEFAPSQTSEHNTEYLAPPNNSRFCVWFSSLWTRPR